MLLAETSSGSQQRLIDVQMSLESFVDQPVMDSNMVRQSTSAW